MTTTEHEELVSQQLTETLVVCGAILVGIGLPFVLTAGTLLGAYRGGKLLGWDKDVDVDVLEEDVKKDMPLPKPKNGYFTLKHTIDGRKINFDVFLMKKRGLYRYKEIGSKPDYPKNKIVYWPAHHYEKKWERIKLGGHWWNIPHEPEGHLREYFGADWKTPDRKWGWVGGAKNSTLISNMKGKWTI
jgi:hypothetical protein